MWNTDWNNPDTKGAFDKKDTKMIEYITNFYEKLEKDTNDQVRCSIIFSVFPCNPILWAVHKKMFHKLRGKDGEHLTKLCISFSKI